MLLAQRQRCGKRHLRCLKQAALLGKGEGSSEGIEGPLSVNEQPRRDERAQRIVRGKVKGTGKGLTPLAREETAKGGALGIEGLAEEKPGLKGHQRSIPFGTRKHLAREEQLGEDVGFAAKEHAAPAHFPGGEIDVEGHGKAREGIDSGGVA